MNGRTKIRILLMVLFSLVLTPQFAHSLDIEPKKTGYATAVINLNWQVDLQNQQVSELQVKTFGFKDYPSQALISESTVPITLEDSDNFNNKIREFNLDPAQNYQTFSMSSEVKVQFNFNFPDAKDASNYLKESNYIKITPEIREQSFQIAAKYGTDMEKAVAIAQWVHNNVKYDRNYISLIKGSQDVFLERAGTCDEFSHLFIAMLRAVGIPAKFSASYVYSGTEWGAHAFVEAAIGGKWVPFDPTFNEAILLDATHIKFGEGLDQQDIKEDIYIRSFSADISKVRLTRDFSITFKETRNFPQLFEGELILPENIIGENSLETIKIRLKNKGNRLAVPLSLLVPKEVEIPGENKFNEDKLILLEPFEEKEIEWKVLIPNLEAGYDYTFPVKIETLGQTFESNLHAAKDGDVNNQEELQVTRIITIDKGDLMQLSITVKNIGNLNSEGNLTITVPGEKEQTKQFSIPTGSEQLIGFTIQKPAGGIRGDLLLETASFRLTQPFSITAEPSAEPAETPAPTETPTAIPPQSVVPDIPNEYLFMAVAMLLISAIFFARAAK